MFVFPCKSQRATLNNQTENEKAPHLNNAFLITTPQQAITTYHQLTLAFHIWSGYYRILKLGHFEEQRKELPSSSSCVWREHAQTDKRVWKEPSLWPWINLLCRVVAQKINCYSKWIMQLINHQIIYSALFPQSYHPVIFPFSLGHTDPSWSYWLVDRHLICIYAVTDMIRVVAKTDILLQI